MKPIKEKLFVFDCEWVPLEKGFKDLEINFPSLAEVFIHQVEKWNLQRKSDGKEELNNEEWWDEKAHFYPEFCKIICVSYGYLNKGNPVIQSIWGEDEEKILKKTSEILDKVNQSGYILSGAGILRFDMPWLSKRMMINGIAPPKNINVFGKKPWEIDVYDIQQVWGQGVYQESFTPLEIISVSLGIPSSKSDLSGSKVKDAYWNGEIIRIKEYCELDVKSSMECAFKLIDLS